MSLLNKLLFLGYDGEIPVLVYGKAMSDNLSSVAESVTDVIKAQSSDLSETARALAEFSQTYQNEIKAVFWLGFLGITYLAGYCIWRFCLRLNQFQLAIQPNPLQAVNAVPVRAPNAYQVFGEAHLNVITRNLEAISDQRRISAVSHIIRYTDSIREEENREVLPPVEEVE